MTTDQNSNRSAAGAKAKHMGALFEGIFERACRARDLSCTRMPDGCRQVGPKKLMRVKTPWDWIVTHKGRTALIDTKTADASTFPYSKIEPHQVREMMSHELRGGIGGYVIWLRESTRVIFIPSSILVPFIGVRGSIKDGHPGVVSLGHLTESPLAGRIELAGIFRRDPGVPFDRVPTAMNDGLGV